VTRDPFHADKGAQRVCGRITRSTNYSDTQGHYLAYMPMAQKSFKYIITKNVIQKMMFLKTKKKGKKKGGGGEGTRPLGNHKKKKIVPKVNTWK
jgi:hypothetical protein